MKICTKCKILKDLNKFSNTKKYKDGKKSACKVCLRAENRNYYSLNFEKESLRKKKQYIQNKDKILETCRNYRQNNKNKLAKQQKLKRKTNQLYSIADNLRIRLNSALKSKKWNKRNHLKQYLGCSLEELKFHLENQFELGMTWNNRSEWHIDHIIPLSSAKNEEELYKLCHYTNLQPLWAIDNIRKSNKI